MLLWYMLGISELTHLNNSINVESRESSILSIYIIEGDLNDSINVESREIILSIYIEGGTNKNHHFLHIGQM